MEIGFIPATPKNTIISIKFNIYQVFSSKKKYQTLTNHQSPERLMALLLRQNPGLPSGALLFVSQVRISGGGWSIFMDEDRRGLGCPRGRENKLSALMEMVHLRPAEK